MQEIFPTVVNLSVPGWHRMALLVLYFAPERLRVPENFDAVSERLLVRTVSPCLHPSMHVQDLRPGAHAWG